MAVTVKKMLSKYEKDYQLEVVAGKEGLDNIISWSYCVEALIDKSFLRGGEVVITTGVGKANEEWLYSYVEMLVQKEVSCLILNVGTYIHTIPEEVKVLCNRHQLPLVKMPLNSKVFEVIKDFCYEIMIDEKNETDIGQTLRSMIFYPREAKQHFHILQEYGFEINKNFLILSIDMQFKNGEPENFNSSFRFGSEKVFRSMKLKYGHFEYEGVREKLQIFIINGLQKDQINELLIQFRKLSRQYVHCETYMGVSPVYGNINNLSKNFRKAQYLSRLGKRKKISPVLFDEAGVDKILISVDDSEVLKEFYLDILGELVQYDLNNNTQYMELLKVYLENDASVQVTADKMFVHRNTINYQLNRIKSITGLNLNTLEERFKLMLAYRIKDFI